VEILRQDDLETTSGEEMMAPFGVITLMLAAMMTLQIWVESTDW